MRKKLKILGVVFCACVISGTTITFADDNVKENQVKYEGEVGREGQNSNAVDEETLTTYELNMDDSNINSLNGEPSNIIKITDLDEKEYELRIDNVQTVKPISEVLFAVWSEVNGQDDLKWYSAQKQGENAYTYRLSLDQHKGLGKYYVHVYVRNADDRQLSILNASEFKTPEPQMGDCTTAVTNQEVGIIHVNASAKENNKFIKKVKFAVWSTEDGQDDLVWYEADQLQEGEYTKDIYISNHKYSLGQYNVHVYIEDITGCFYGVKALQQNVDVIPGKVEITQNEDFLSYTEKITDAVVPGGITEVLFPTWSENNGQDDIQWYAAEKKDDIYTKNISLKSHKGFGTYNVHAYARTKGGKLVYIGKNSFHVNEPKIKEFKIEKDEEKGTFKVTLFGIENGELIQKIQIPVWSEANGQDDLIWYNAEKQKNGEYIVNVDIKNHKYSLGKYIFHAYVTDITGQITGFVVGNEQMQIKAGKISAEQNKNNPKQYTIKIDNVNIPGENAQIYFPVWSEVNGQDDIQWYKADKIDNGVYETKISLTDHKGLGKFNVHVYAKMPNGVMNGIEASYFETDSPQIGDVQIIDEKKDSGEFQVKITGIQHDELIKKIQVPVWSEDNQSDIIWYDAVKDNDGNYVVNVNISKHHYNPRNYNVHIYLTDITGIMQGMAATKCDMSASYEKYSVIDVDNSEKTFKVSLEGLKVPAGEKSILFAVWGDESGQNDIHWYNAKKKADGSYECSVNIRDHRELGTYNVHAYIVSKSGSLTGLAATKFEVKKVPHIAGTTISEVNGTSGRFKVTVSGVFADSGVEKVQIPVWCADNQSDIRWYDAMKVSEGTYVTNVNVANHAHHFGAYKIHVYATMGNGVQVGIAATSTTIEPKNYVYMSSINQTTCEVGIMGATASRVQFPTWSDANGQDDVVWYEGVNQGNGKWTAVVDSIKHNSAGNYTTHVYVTDQNGFYSVGAVQYSLARIPTEQNLIQSRANLYNSSTPYLILVNRSTHKVGVFQGWQGNWNCIQYWDCSDGAPGTPTVEGRFTVGIRGYYFDSGASRCYWYTQFKGNYLFHSVLYNKNGTLRDGRLGMPLSHGCVRLDINNAKWIYDTIPAGTTVVVYH